MGKNFTVWGRSLGSNVFDMPGGNSQHLSKEPTGSSTRAPYHTPMSSTLSFCSALFKLIFSLYQLSQFCAEQSPLFLPWKINSHYSKGEAERNRTRRQSYPCQSDPAWRLSSPLIALLISSPLSLDLGQQAPLLEPTRDGPSAWSLPLLFSGPL